MASQSREQYEINRNKNEVGKVLMKMGYGYIGLGGKRQAESLAYEAKRESGQNRYDAFIDLLKYAT
ncbi:hypothetical protein [Microcoleus sp. S13C4]|uniref:hypothetical protein n=1 Tax=Microcoleus sp. S13C4 TaxID=3055410 RepID=UPI002FD42344